MNFRFKGVHLIAAFSLITAGCLSVHLPQIKLGAKGSEETFDWNAIVNETLQNNPDLQAAKYSVNSVARSRDIAIGGFHLPTVTGELNRDQTRTSTSSTSEDLDAHLIVKEPFFNGFKSTGDFIKAKKDLEAEKWSYRSTSAAVRFRLRTAYIELLRLNEQLEVSRKIEIRRKRNAELIKLRYEAGREHLGSSLRAEAIAEQAAFDVRQIQRQIQSQILRLGREIGASFEEPAGVEGDLEKMIPILQENAPDYSELAGKVPGVQEAIKNAESFKAAIISAQGDVWPTVDGTFEHGYSGTRAADLKRGEDSFLGIKVAVPFFNGGRNINGIRKAKADYEAACESARSTRDEAIAQLADSWTQWVNATEQVGIRKKFLEAARKRSEIVRSEYETGLVNFQDFDIAEQDIADSEKNYVESLANASAKQAGWELSRGLGLEEALA